jgi:hypothetical protein
VAPPFTASQSRSCPRGHRLHWYRVASGPIACSKCRRSDFGKRASMYRCQTCDWHCCVACQKDLPVLSAHGAQRPSAAALYTRPSEAILSVELAVPAGRRFRLNASFVARPRAPTPPAAGESPPHTHIFPLLLFPRC